MEWVVCKWPTISSAGMQLQLLISSADKDPVLSKTRMNESGSSEWCMKIERYAGSGNLSIDLIGCISE